MPEGKSGQGPRAERHLVARMEKGTAAVPLSTDWDVFCARVLPLAEWMAQQGLTATWQVEEEKRG